jgi:hypothetical protein
VRESRKKDGKGRLGIGKSDILLFYFIPECWRRVASGEVSRDREGR